MKVNFQLNQKYFKLIIQSTKNYMDQSITVLVKFYLFFLVVSEP